MREPRCTTPQLNLIELKAPQALGAGHVQVFGKQRKASHRHDPSEQLNLKGSERTCREADLGHRRLPAAASAQATASFFEAQATPQSLKALLYATGPVRREDKIHGGHQANARSQHHATNGTHLKE